jgi:hypothetical protein
VTGAKKGGKLARKKEAKKKQRYFSKNILLTSILYSNCSLLHTSFDRLSFLFSDHYMVEAIIDKIQSDKKLPAQ